MISILIPIFNKKITTMVKRLKKQCENCKIDYEIICLDDASKKSIKKKNEILRAEFKVNYVELSENIGRAKIRNWLAKLARYDNLLFLDCDVRIPKKFIKNYLPHLENYSVIYGGRSYTDKPPRSNKKYLHWLYGSKIESKPAKQRNRSPYLNLMSNNLLVKAAIMKENIFPEDITGYGYEDLALAFLYQKKDIPVLHIDNPVIHTGLDVVDDFLHKTENAVTNLIKLEQEDKIMDTRLMKTYQMLKKYHALPLVKWYLDKNQKKYKANLISKKPNVRYLQQLKLYYYINNK